MQAIERKIITLLISDLKAAGYQVAAVWDGGEYVLAGQDQRITSSVRGDEKFSRPLTDEEALHAIDSVDDSTLHFTHQGRTTWGNRGVSLVLGNGRDVICDHHDPRGEPFSAVIDAVLERVDGLDREDDAEESLEAHTGRTR